MNAEWPPFKNGEHNSESASTFDRDIVPLTNQILRAEPDILIFNCNSELNPIGIISQAWYNIITKI